MAKTAAEVPGQEPLPPAEPSGEPAPAVAARPAFRPFAVTGPAGPQTIKAHTPAEAKEQYRRHFGLPKDAALTTHPEA